MSRWVCIHGHFYQPPRENPWLEQIEAQDSAYPYHDWNERITAECYAPNASSRVLDDRGRIVEIIDNYERMSFNFGPTLLAWLRRHERSVYDAIVEADRRSIKRFDGHGSAIAQAYNHMIMPLANRRDKVTQVVWGIADFEHHFGRKPAGMWLPETAVDLETLDIMAEHGIEFTILAPSQAARVRPIPAGGDAADASGDSNEWTDVSGARVDTNHAYVQRLESGRSINVFFYDGPIAQAVAFEKLLTRGEDFAARLLDDQGDDPNASGFVHIATDGETYGHHHRFGEMALAFAMRSIENGDRAELTNYGKFLAGNPPTQQVQIEENTSWSCKHGVERWRADCGCNSTLTGNWRQEWRAPLRDALDWLRDDLEGVFEKDAAELFNNPWAARDDYISVVLDRSAENIEAFLARHAKAPLEGDLRVRAMKLLEMQRHAMLMYTSCGWFFDDLGRIETLQIIRYAGRCVQLAQELFGDHREEKFVRRLKKACSNDPEVGDGEAVYDRFVRPARVDLRKVCAHFVVSSIFERPEARSQCYCYQIDVEDVQFRNLGASSMVVGKGRITSIVTLESESFSFGGLHLRDHNVTAGVREYRGDESYRIMRRETTEAFDKGELAEIIRSFDRHFGKGTYSLKSLFRDEQIAFTNRVLRETLDKLEDDYGRLYENHAPMMRFLAEQGTPMPRAFEISAEFVLNNRLRETLNREPPEPERVESLLREATRAGVKLDHEGLAHTFRGRLEDMAGRLRSDPANVELLENLEVATAILPSLPFTLDLFHVQNICYELRGDRFLESKALAEGGDEGAREWNERFIRLGGHLSMLVE